MTTTVRIAESSEKHLVQHLDQFYLYEFSRFMPNRYKVAADGMFHDGDYFHYWEESCRYPYLIFHDEEIAGFALVQDTGSNSLMDQFFVMYKFQGMAVARAAAYEIFDRHAGAWLVESLITNPKSEGFWPKIIECYTNGEFARTVQEPNRTHHEYRFSSAGGDRDREIE